LLKPGGFLAVNIADILCFADPTLPRIQAENLGGHRLPITRADVLHAQAEHPDYNRYQLADLLGVSEQTIDRRLKHNNIRGGKYQPQTRVRLVGDVVESAARAAGLPLYDRRVWVKDPAWENSRWHTNSYRAVDEFEYIYVFWKPGITRVNRARLSPAEWVEWGSRAVWCFASVRANDDHEAKFPLELPRRVIRLLTEPGDTVLDCFVGSGTTALAAIETGRHYLGIDRLKKYVTLARRACTAAQRGLGK
jgi:site-specific DNA-methyltransferase (adenine-specific)